MKYRFVYGLKRNGFCDLCFSLQMSYQNRMALRFHICFSHQFKMVIKKQELHPQKTHFSNFKKQKKICYTGIWTVSKNNNFMKFTWLDFNKQKMRIYYKKIWLRNTLIISFLLKCWTNLESLSFQWKEILNTEEHEYQQDLFQFPAPDNFF